MNNPLNILFLSSWYPNRKDPTLGIFVRRHAEAASILNRITLIHAHGDEDMLEGEFRIKKSESGNFREIIISYGPSKAKIPLFRKLKNIRLKKKYYDFALEKALEWSGKFELIHLHIPWPLGSLVRRYSKKLAIPYLVSEHWTGYQPEDGRYRGKILKQATEKTTAEAKAVVVVSEYLLSAMKSQGVPGNYHIIPNVVDTNLFHAGIKQNDTFKLLHVSSLNDQQKNVSGIIQAFASAKKEEPLLSLTIVGSGEDEIKLKRICQELGLAGRSIFFIGRKMEEELVAEFQKAHAFVLNSRFENQVVVLLEALSCGIPVLAPAIGSTDSQLNGQCGILFNPDDENALKEAMVKVCRDYQQFQPETIRQYALTHFSYDVVSGKFDSLYREILNK